MELTGKTIVAFAAVIFTGLSAGLFYAWSVSVIPGTKKVADLPYLQTMQSINRAILNPAFFIIFFGSLIALGIGSVYQFSHNQASFWLMFAAFICYFIGTMGVTAWGNVPLNNQLDALDLVEMSTGKIREFRHYYETNWNRLHLARTIFSVISFSFSILAVFAYFRN